jgi:hypothetical protein
VDTEGQNGRGRTRRDTSRDTKRTHRIDALGLLEMVVRTRGGSFNRRRDSTSG